MSIITPNRARVRLLLSTQRSGSHFIKAFINAHFAETTCSGEVLEKAVPQVTLAPALSAHPEVPHFWPWYQRGVAAGNLPNAPAQRLHAFGGYLAGLAILTGAGDLLVDAKYTSIRSLSDATDADYSTVEFSDFVKARHIPVLHLLRKNILKIIISYKLARQTGIWHRTNDASPEIPRAMIRLDPKGVLVGIRFAHQMARDYQKRFRGQPGYAEVIYEDLVEEQRRGEGGPQLQTLSRFFGRSPTGTIGATLAYQKTTPDDPSEVVENWDEVVRLLRATEYGWMTEPSLVAV